MSKQEESSSPGSLSDGLDATLPGETQDDLDPGGHVDRDEPLHRGADVGRYTVLDRIGAGGMGVVYAAFDPQLDRRVALKVMHAGGGSAFDSGGRARLLREAQAMAKLSHPNVITVHDVGTFGDRVFVAMEFIEGQTLREWCTAEKDWTEVVESFVCAGRGLGAAHAVGLVHRDFKPDNVLIGADGRVLVMDFGLARQASARTGPVLPDVAEVVSKGPLVETRDLTLTRTGAMLGTPAYMAPEQHRGEPIGAHADQFSFCVALYESLYTERPFEGSSMTSLAMNVLDGRIRPAPRDTKVPSWLRAVVLRGLALEPNDRFPSMDALLAELQRDPPQARRPWLVAGIALGVGGIITVAYVGTRSNRLEACKTDSQRFDELWSAQRRDALQRRYASSDIPYATTTWQSVSGALDRYGEQWAGAYETRCAADARARQSSKPRYDDPALLCLDDALRDVDRLLLRLEDPLALAQGAREGVAAAQNLVPPARCVGIRRHDNRDRRLLASESEREQLDAIHEALSEARVRVLLGEADAARSSIGRAYAKATSAKTPRLQAEALVLGAHVELLRGEATDAEAKLREAILLSAQTSHDKVEASAWSLTMHVVALRQGLFDEGRRVALGAEAAIARAGDDPVARARLLVGLGAIAQAEGSYTFALESFERALSIQVDEMPSGDIRLAETHEWIGTALEGLARYRTAAEHHNASLAIREQVLGTSHPLVARSLLRLSAAMQGFDRVDAVYATLVRARMVLDPSGSIELADLAPPTGAPPKEPEGSPELDDALDLARCFDQLGLLERAREDFDLAARLHARAVALMEHTLGPEHRDIGYALVNLGLALADQRRHPEALPHLRRGLDVWTKTLPPGHPDLGFAHLNLANSLWATGQSESAREHYGMAKTIWESAMGEEHPHLGYALTGLGRTLLETGETNSALAALERAFELRDHEDEDDFNVAEVSLLLGRAQYLTGRDPARALALIVQARDTIGAYEPTDPAGLERVLTGGEMERFTDQLVPAGLGVNNRYRPR